MLYHPRDWSHPMNSFGADKALNRTNERLGQQNRRTVEKSLKMVRDSQAAGDTRCEVYPGSQSEFTKGASVEMTLGLAMLIVTIWLIVTSPLIAALAYFLL